MPLSSLLVAVAALSSWLPAADSAFNAWSKAQTTVVHQYDYFVCRSEAPASEARNSFAYAGRGCTVLLKGATRFSYGNGEPTTGAALYDRAHGILFFNAGCCAWRGYVLASGIGAPPSPIGDADLRHIATMRGVALGMTKAQVIAIYGPGKPRPTRPGVTTISFTTMSAGPNNSPEPCGQFQSFSFRNDRLISIELLAGC
jgi:hypothetical protein